jgi:hypothetical protein
MLQDKKFVIGKRTLFEHLLMAFCDFTCEPQYRCGDLRRMLPNSKGVWKMHTPGLRIYGWAPKIHEFAAVTFATEMDTKSDKELNNQKLVEVEAFIKSQGLTGTIIRGDILAVFPHPN